MKTAALILILLSVFYAALKRPAFGQAQPDDPIRMIATEAGITDDDRSKIAAGEVFVKTLKTSNKQEIAVIGVIHISGIAEITLERFRDSLSQREGGLRPGGRFSSPPHADDLKGFELSTKDIAELAKCTVGSCDFNLSEEAISRFEKSAGESKETFGQMAPEIFREVLLGYISKYRERGNAGLGEYANKRKVVDLTKTHGELLTHSGLLKELSPNLYEYLLQFPESDSAAVESQFFWSTANFGLKPMVTLSHISSAEATSESGPTFAVATKQIYATRYLDASLSFAILAPDGSPGEYYLIFADRSRSDVLGGLLGGLARTPVEAEAVDRVRKLLMAAAVNLKTQDVPTNSVETSDEHDEINSSPLDLLIRYWMLSLAAAFLLLGLGIWAFRRTRIRPNG